MSKMRMSKFERKCWARFQRRRYDTIRRASGKKPGPTWRMFSRWLRAKMLVAFIEQEYMNNAPADLVLMFPTDHLFAYYDRNYERYHGEKIYDRRSCAWK